MRPLILVLILAFLILVLSAATDGQETTTRIEGGMVTNAVEALQVTAGPLSFESGKVYYIHPGALTGVSQLTLDDIHDTEIHFLAPLKGTQMYWTTYGDDVGILNITDCTGLKITGLDVENEYEFQVGNVILETGVAVNVSRSVVTFEHCTITSNAKCALIAHSGSDVTIEDSTINAFYFEFMVGASDLTARRCNLNQDHTTPDSHSAIWTGSSMRNGVTNVLYENTNVTLEQCLLDMKDGRAIVSGNGSYTTRSNVTLDGIGFVVRDQAFGICTWHENFNSITVTVGPNGIAGYDGSDDFHSAVDGPGFARFINYYTTPTTPGGAGAAAPIIIDGVSSVNVTP